jgi:hypothetical protein
VTTDLPIFFCRTFFHSADIDNFLNVDDIDYQCRHCEKKFYKKYTKHNSKKNVGSSNRLFKNRNEGTGILTEKVRT